MASRRKGVVVMGHAPPTGGNELLIAGELPIESTEDAGSAACQVIADIRSHQRSTCRAALSLAAFFARGGDRHLVDEDGRLVQYPLAYFATATELDESYVCRLRQFGEVLRVLQRRGALELPVGNFDSGAARMREVPRGKVPSERALRPLAKLLGRPELEPAYTRAVELARQEDKPLSGRHVGAAVRDALACKSAPGGSGNGTESKRARRKRKRHVYVASRPKSPDFLALEHLEDLMHETERLGWPEEATRLLHEAHAFISAHLTEVSRRRMA